MENQPFIEKRAHPRFQVGIPTSYKRADSNERAQTETYDVSAQGLCLLTDKELPAGSCLDIDLEMLDNGEKIYKRGRVIWSNIMRPVKYRTGIELEEPNLNPIPLILRRIKVRRKH